ncbi:MULTISPECIES: class I SAM-dependent methyltransferase [Comamonas]|uniref:class I SAM-dependent methyltransferase n=1 Tax=Comamonas TaxID=283 RepID=UPI00237E1D40|nr:class I SAM-dependent methyltransferase [Comamonas aquatica]MDE1554603.1 class I SAM-dependent methyltransferase [Comamonas aquatica]MDH0382275.1 class I SAM-dependent methyltransferase [Comamonas aquatica]MDH0428682.1 class I SAM-dependent methyltransferase [Comamonas aquatica]MDH0939802.1 class I SAM-dependent methyltransferase [Comamonas aquatica]
MHHPADRTDAAYVHDVPYPAHFHRETMPAWLCATLTAMGLKSPDLTRPYTYLDLGCGSGLNTLIAAATNPLGQFLGIDIHPGAIAQARARAQALGMHNLRYECLDFAAATQSPAALPACDFMVCHGVYSWIAPPQRQALRQLVQQRLKPGGVFYLAYMSQPGSSAMAATQKLLHLATQPLPGSSADQARAGVAWLQHLTQQGLGHFVEQPRLVQEIDRLAALDADYLAHELLNPHWDSLHVADVMADLDAVDCRYAASATPLENLDAVSLPGQSLPAFQALQRQGASPALLETFKDVARNQNQRRDLYLRQHPAGLALPSEEHRQALLRQRIGLLPAAPQKLPPTQGELVLDTRIGPVHLPVAQVAPLITALRHGAASYAELARLPAYAHQPGLISQLLQVLAWAGWLHVLLPAGTGPVATALAPLNTYLRMVTVGQPPTALQALEAIGSAVPA